MSHILADIFAGFRLVRMKHRETGRGCLADGDLFDNSYTSYHDSLGSSQGSAPTLHISQHNLSLFCHSRQKRVILNSVIKN
ncbi:hypothetical protein MICAK_3040004 [Microcystis aeruginosa PCC 9701]|uniref:Uncharacterized protein n=1 Tax=Microcystis aeruginosa PCC 9701 TaxID=721123 RepID=I4IS37_MICAE|nr:hypothetical protein MICAK_3040004 [Microcystis aeruginosa PCC 9701]